MHELTQRQGKILQCFQRDEILTSMQLASALQISQKTLRNEIKTINTAYPNLILSIKGQGYQVNQFHNDLSTLLIEEKDSIGDTRYLLILKYILAEGEMDYYELAQQMFISESTLDKQILSLNAIINRRDPSIRIERKNNRLYITGNEAKHRQIYTYLMNHEMDQYNFNLSNYDDFFTMFDLAQIKELVLQFHQEHHLQLRDFETISFILHIAIMLERVSSGNAISGIDGYQSNLQAQTLAKEFAQQLHAHFDIALSEMEYKYLACLFAGKLSDQTSENINRYQTFIETITHDLHALYDLDLMNDEEFKESLLIHLLGLDSRIRSGSFLNNPLIKDIKLHFPLLYDMSVYIASKLQEFSSTKLLEDEIGYLTLHLMSAVEKQRQPLSKRIVIINPLGNGASNYIKAKLTQLSDVQAEIVSIFSMFDLTAIASCKPDLIITFLPIQESIDIPIYECFGFPKEQDLKRISALLQEPQKTIHDIHHFFHEELFFTQREETSKEAIIHFLCEQLQLQGYCEDGYEEQVLARERIAPTAYGNAFAIPHPIIKCAKQHAIAIAILKQPIAWNNRKVKMIFLFALAPEKNDAFDDVFSQLVQLLDFPTKVKAMIKEENYSEFLSTFLSKN